MESTARSISTWPKVRTVFKSIRKAAKTVHEIAKGYTSKFSKHPDSGIEWLCLS